MNKIGRPACPCPDCGQIKPFHNSRDGKKKYRRCYPCENARKRNPNPRPLYGGRIFHTPPLGWDLNREGLAWAAGFFDGEGCVTTSRRREERKIRTTNTLRLMVAQVDLRPLYRMRAIIAGMGKIYSSKDGHGRPISYLTLYSFEQVQATVCLLWHWLSAPKHEQIVRAFTEHQSRWKTVGQIQN